MKQCSVCKKVKPLAEFPKNCTHKDGLASRCKVCHNNEHKQRRKQVGSITWAKDKLTILRYHAKKEGYAAPIGSPEEVVALWLACEGKCDVKGCTQTGKRLCLDHDHVSGVIRGFLCVPHNVLLGRIESPQFLPVMEHLNGRVKN